MFPAQRISLLKKLLIEKKSVDTATLCSYLEVSDVTVRKYLDKLEQEGFLIKMHGGAMLAPSYSETSQPEYEQLDIEHLKEKEEIAKLAATLVEEGDNLFLGSGSTCYLLSKELYKTKNITVVTNNFNCVKELAPYITRLFFVGGDVSSRSGLMHSQGSAVISQLDGIYVSKAFFSVEGLDIRAGVTLDNLGEAEIIRKVRAAAAQSIILADSSKLDKFGLHKVCALTDFSTYVTDKKVPERYKKYLYENNIKLLTSYDV